MLIALLLVFDNIMPTHHCPAILFVGSSTQIVLLMKTDKLIRKKKKSTNPERALQVGNSTLTV